MRLLFLLGIVLVFISMVVFSCEENLDCGTQGCCYNRACAPQLCCWTRYCEKGGKGKGKGGESGMEQDYQVKFLNS